MIMQAMYAVANFMIAGEIDPDASPVAKYMGGDISGLDIALIIFSFALLIAVYIFALRFDLRKISKEAEELNSLK